LEVSGQLNGYDCMWMLQGTVKSATSGEHKTHFPISPVYSTVTIHTELS